MFKKLCVGLALISATGLALADNAPSMHQVYEAAQSGHLQQAEQMMSVVLQQHPNSAKAHYVDAEILAREGKLDQARAELANARQFDSNLRFAKPAAVNALEMQLSGNHAATAASAPQAAHFPWSLVLMGLAAIALVFWIVRMFSARNNAVIQSPPFYPGAPSATPYGGAPYGGAPVMPMGGGMVGSGGGMGSGIMSGLVTGAAVGAGMVAGEELAHHFMDGDRSTATPVADSAQQDDWGSSANSNMGGNDFGVSDSGSWDDGSSSMGGDFGGGGDDWT